MAYPEYPRSTTGVPLEHHWSTPGASLEHPWSTRSTTGAAYPRITSGAPGVPRKYPRSTHGVPGVPREYPWSTRSTTGVPPEYPWSNRSTKEYPRSTPGVQLEYPWSNRSTKEYPWSTTGVPLECPEYFTDFQITTIEELSYNCTFLPTWNCVSLPRPTTSSGWKLLRSVQLETNRRQSCNFNVHFCCNFSFVEDNH